MICAVEYILWMIASIHRSPDPRLRLLLFPLLTRYTSSLSVINVNLMFSRMDSRSQHLPTPITTLPMIWKALLQRYPNELTINTPVDFKPISLGKVVSFSPRPTEVLFKTHGTFFTLSVMLRSRNIILIHLLTSYVIKQELSGKISVIAFKNLSDKAMLEYLTLPFPFANDVPLVVKSRSKTVNVGQLKNRQIVKLRLDIITIAEDFTPNF